ncbi:MAG: tryptophanase [Ignavibacteria bacterium]|jgi:tryptophanase|nr:tryptophanase [Ignavibacteria bacterium]
MKTQIEPFKIKTVEHLYITTVEQREQYLKESSYNPFSLRSDRVTIDLLTDSGTTAMSSKQWAAIMDGDEAYAGSVSYYKFEDAVRNFSGFKYIIPTHQGRAAEKVLFSVVLNSDSVVPNNTHFDTTHGNIDFLGATALDLPTDEGVQPELIAPFKGNMDIQKLENTIKKYGKERIPIGLTTITNNSGGGQPVSMQNIRETSEVLHKYGIPFFIDCCRFAENAYFIKLREKGYENTPVIDICREMFSYADGALMSCKKDGMSNTGGFIATNNEKIAEGCRTNLIIMEGFLTYGGLARRDLEALAIGFTEVVDENYLKYRVGQSTELAKQLTDAGVPLVLPAGAHALYIDAKRFAPHIKPEHFPGQSISCELYRLAGIRACEIGSIMFGRYENGQYIAPPMELVRLAIPRRVYTKSHMDYIAEAVIEAYNNREKLRPMKITWEAKFLRHFTVKCDYL